MLLQIDLPDPLVAKARAQAARKRMSLDDWIAKGLAVGLKRREPPPTIAERAARPDLKKFQEILDRVPNIPPVPGDE